MSAAVSSLSAEHFEDALKALQLIGDIAAHVADAGDGELVTIGVQESPSADPKERFCVFWRRPDGTVFACERGPSRLVALQRAVAKFNRAIELEAAVERESGAKS